MPTRQQKRARKRAPVRRKRKGSAAFIAIVTAVLLAGGAGVFFLRAGRPTTPQRGAIVGEHWHAAYRIELCGRVLAPYPFVEGEIHTHGDGQIHLHPNSQVFANENANLGAFFRTVESRLTQTPDGKTVFTLPDGTNYEDGGTCPGSDETYDVEVYRNDEQITESPDGLILHEGDEILVRFGPEAAPDAETIPNPLEAQTPPQPAPQPPAAEDAPPAEGEEAPPAGEAPPPQNPGAG